MSTTTFWLIFTDLIVASAIIVAVIFALTALVQWIRRKSFKKIDRELRWALLPFSLMALTYLVFEKLWIIDVRPNGSGEPSFPSTHTMITATVFFLTIIILPRYIKSRRLRLVLDILMLAAIILIAVGRVLANMHWPTDVAAGIVFSAIFAIIYALILRRVTPKSPQKSKKSKSHSKSPKSAPQELDQILPKPSK